MSNIPVLRSREQIIGAIIDGFLARVQGVNDLSRASVISQFIQAIGGNVFKSSADVIALVNALSVDNSTGEALQRLARDKNVPIFSASPSNGKVRITDLSFNKIETSIYSGQPAPVAGSLIVYVTDASKMVAANGKVYIGRGSINVEGPLEYNTVTQEGGGAYWAINLKPTSPTTRFHNIGEKVVFAQGGNRPITVGSIVQTPQGSAINSVTFTTTSQATIPDGEVEVTDVPVVCGTPGPIGNVPRGAIRDAIAFPFNASVFNDNAFANGRDADTEDDIRSRIKQYEAAKSKGTETAIKLASENVTSPDDLKRVTSSATVRYADGSCALIFDDGTGYEPIFDGAQLENIVDEALGGEKELQLRQIPIAQARVKNNLYGPYGIINNSYLAVKVQNEITEHRFVSSDFKVPGQATATEVVNSINNDYTIGFLASTFGGSLIVIYPKDPQKNDIQVTVPTAGDDSNDILGFAINVEYTARIYKNDTPLYQDGLVAAVDTKIKADWSSSITSGDTLSYKVDGTPELTITFLSSDFQDVDPTSVMSNLTTADIWVSVLNGKMPGLTATLNGDFITFSSNLAQDNRASIEFTGGTLLYKIFTPGQTLLATGRTPDYTLNRQTGQISLVDSLSSGDKLTAGSNFTRANSMTASMPNGPSVSGKVWMVVDGNADGIPNSLLPNTTITFAKAVSPDGTFTITGTTPSFTPQGFDLVKTGDWILIWSNSTDPAALIQNSGFWRIEAVSGSQLTVYDKVGYARTNGAGIFNTDRFVIVRSPAPVQQLSFTAGSLSNLITEINDQLYGVDADIVGSQVRISTKTFGVNGELFFLAADAGGRNLGLPISKIIDSQTSHYGFTVTKDSEAGIPNFTMGTFGTAISDTDMSVTDYLEEHGNGHDFVEILDKFDATNLVEKIDSNIGRRVFVKDFDSLTGVLSMNVPDYMRAISTSLQPDDRFFIRSAYQFDSSDIQTVVVDGDPLTKSYGLSVARRLMVSSHSAPTVQDFSANDAESSLNLNDTSSFNGFDFVDFLAMRRSRAILTNGTGPTDYSIKFNSSDFGESRIGVGIVYPKTNTQSVLTHLSSIDDIAELSLVLPVTTPRTPNWDQTSSFTADVTTINGRDEVKFTYRSGLQPLFTVLGANVSVGDVAIISSSANFLGGNRGIEARVINVNNTDFTIELPTGLCSSDNIVFSAIQNINGVITISTIGNHNINTGDRIGLWDTAPTTGVTKPMNGSYIASVLSPTSFTVQATSSVPGRAIQAATHSANEIVVVSNSHGLYEGNIVILSSIAGGSYNGLAAVSAVDNPNQFRLVKQGSSAAVSSGRFDFQSYLPSATLLGSITTLSMDQAGLVTVNTATPHGMSSGMLAKIDSVTLQSYSGVSTYGIDDLVVYTGVIYKSLNAGNTGNQPDISPANWTVANDKDLLGIFTINVTGPSQFTYSFNHTSATPHTLTNGTGGTFTVYVATGSLARALGGSSSDNLQFGKVSTTAQDIIDYVAANLSDRLIASLYNGQVGTAVIDRSTRDLDAPFDYFVGTISRIKTIKSKNLVELDADVNILVGSHIKVSGFTSGLVSYNNDYIVVKSVEVVAGTTWRLSVQSDVFAIDTTISTPGGVTFTGYRSFVGFEDGINSVKLTDLGSLSGSPQFTVKRPWSLAPEINEEIRLVAVTSDQLVRFWNLLIVTGLSNVGTVKNSEYGRQVQISTLTFGGDGSVQVTGGSANNGFAALVGSAAEINNKIGVAYIPYELRKGLSVNGWIKISNTVRQNKQIGLSGLSAVRVWSDGLSITTPPGSFQTVRSTTQDKTTKFRIEQHGGFMSISRIGGTALLLGTAGIQEGDWVRIKNTRETVWNSGTAYTTGNRVFWNNFNWTALAGSTGVIPGTDATKWESQEWTSSNQGIYRVVRVWGEDSFWVEAPNMIEEMIKLGNANNISFYSYDSVMPGDTLVIATDALGAVNMGRFTVVDDSYGTGYVFPTATRIYTTPIPNATGSIVLGGNYNQLNVEEKDPIESYKRIFSMGISGSQNAAIVVDTPTLMNRYSSSLGAVITFLNKLDNSVKVNYGVDAYRYYGGLIRQLNKVIYGDPVNPTTYPGVHAAGTDVNIREAILKRIILGMSIRVKIGVPFAQVKDRVRSSVAGYINGLGTGKQVSFSKIIEAAQRVNGVESVVITSPIYSAANDLIAVNPDQKAYVVDPTTDIIVSVLSD